jgi:hypothetical protein
MIWPTILK